MGPAVASGTQGPRPGGSPRRRTLAIAIAIGALSLAGIPSATAKSSHEHHGTGEGATPTAASAPASETAPTTAPAGAPDHGGTGSSATQPGSGPIAKPGKPLHRTSSAPATKKGPAAAGEGAAARKAERRESHNQRKDSKDIQLSQPSQQLAAIGHKHQAGGRLQTTTKQAQRKVLRQRAKGSSSAGSGAVAGSSASAAPAAAAAQSASPAPAPAIASPPASVQAPATGSVRTSVPVRRPRARRHRAPVSSPVARPTPALAATTLSAARTASPALSRAAKPPARAKARQSPIVTTITRIVGVVPSDIWVLVAILTALALALAARTRLSAIRARRLEKQRGELLEDVGLLQAALLPVPPATVGAVGTTAAYRPASGPAAGGDFYDVFGLEDGRLAVIVGDVSGHGRDALPHTALVRYTLRAYLEAGLSPRVAVRTAGAVLEHQLGPSFATVLAATYDPRERLLVYSSAGHPPPIVLGAKTVEPVTVASAPPVGVGMRTGTRQTAVSIPGAAQVCFHTDGVTEARVGGRRELYGSERLIDALSDVGPRGTAADLLDRVTEQTGSRPDDMAACLLRIDGPVAAPRIVAEQLELDRDDIDGERIERFLLAAGVGRDDVREMTHRAQATAQRAGSVIIDLQLGEGSPTVTLQRDNIAYIQPRLATAQQSEAMVSR
jgi:hypothetical protein